MKKIYITLSAFDLIGGSDNWRDENTANDVFEYANKAGDVLIASTYDIEPYSDTKNIEAGSRRLSDTAFMDFYCWLNDRGLLIPNFKGDYKRNHYKAINIQIPANIVEAIARADARNAGSVCSDPKALQFAIMQQYGEYLEANGHAVRQNYTVRIKRTLKEDFTVSAFSGQQARIKGMEAAERKYGADANIVIDTCYAAGN